MRKSKQKRWTVWMVSYNRYGYDPNHVRLVMDQLTKKEARTMTRRLNLSPYVISAWFRYDEDDL